MTKNFSKYQNIIDEFRGQVSNRNFETVFTDKCAHIPKTDRFLLKMELKRLAGNCARLIDLRGHVDGECRLYEHENRTHYLDDVAIKVFQENMMLYGKYTFGVYEAVNNTENNFRVIYQQEKSDVVAKKTQEVVKKAFDKTQYPASVFRFGTYCNRFEERMNFAISLLVTSEDKSIQCNSCDLSVLGCKFRVSPSDKFTIGQVITIRFTGLEQEFQFGTEDLFEYEVMNLQLTEGVQLVGAKRINIDEKKRGGFTQFLKGFIQGNKRRYKINLDNTINAVQARNFEQYILPKSNELPVFIASDDNKSVPKYALNCPNNQHIYQYWQDENHHSTLNFLITPERVERLKKYASLGKPLLVYSFIHNSKGKYFFYTADECQLRESDGFMSEFLGFAANKDNFAISSLSLSSIDINQANSFFTLSDSITTRDKYLNLPASEEVITGIRALDNIVVVNDLTNDLSLNLYKSLPYDQVVPAKLRVFGHKKLVSPIQVDKLGINYKNHRQESRFKYITPVEVTCKKELLIAESIDFSASGMKLEFDNEVSLNKGDIVQLSFPSLQKITSSFDLKKLPYEVVRINKKKTIINLHVYVEHHKHIGRAFFKALIDKNKNKLTPDEYAIMLPGIAKPLRNIYTSCINIPTLVVQTSGSRYKIDSVALGKEHGKLLPLMRLLSDRPGFYNLYPLLSNVGGMNLLTNNLKKMHSTDPAITDTLYIAINPDSDDVEKSVITKLESELNTLQLKQMFIKVAKRRGTFFCVQLKISRTDAPVMDYLTPELSYISSYAIHRGKQIEQDIWNVVGVIQVIDITQEALIRAELSDLINQDVLTNS